MLQSENASTLMSFIFKNILCRWGAVAEGGGHSGGWPTGHDGEPKGGDQGCWKPTGALLEYDRCRTA